MMSSDRIVAWVQVVTGLAVLTGLVLVLVELRLSSKLAYTAQVGAAFDIQHQFRQSQIGETPTAGVFVRGCLSPAELSDEEIFVFDTLVSGYGNLARRAMFVEQFGEFGNDWELIARDYLRFSLGTKVGRFDYETYKNEWPPALAKVAQELINAGEVVFCKQRYEQLFQAVRSEQPWWDEGSHR